MSDSDNIPELVTDSSSDEDDYKPASRGKAAASNPVRKKGNDSSDDDVPMAKPQTRDGFSRGFLNNKTKPLPLPSNIPGTLTLPDVYSSSDDEELKRGNKQSQPTRKAATAVNKKAPKGNSKAIPVDDDDDDLPDLLSESSDEDDDFPPARRSTTVTTASKLKKKKRAKKPKKKRKPDSVIETEEVRVRKELAEAEEQKRLEDIRVQEETRMQIQGAIKIQSIVRMAHFRRLYAPAITARVKDRRDVVDMWGDVMKALCLPLPKQFSWLDEKDRVDMVVSDSALEALLGHEAVQERKQIEKLQAIRNMALDSEDDIGDLAAVPGKGVRSELHDSTNETSVAHGEPSNSSNGLSLQDITLRASQSSDDETDEEIYCDDDVFDRGDIPSFEMIELSDNVHKWLVQSDKLHVEQFWRCMDRLAAGGRTYSLMKRLKGCSYPIYESKLNKGDRILWTEVLRPGDTRVAGENRTILVRLLAFTS
jgi:hypothetical protein